MAARAEAPLLPPSLRLVLFQERREGRRKGRRKGWGSG